VRREVKLFFVLFLLFILFFSFNIDLPRRQNWGFFSDESGYFSIIQSLVYDFDIKYTRQDLLRIQKHFPSGPVGIQLKKGGDGNIYYAKSFAYPLFAAPFFGLFKVKGLLLFNGLMLFLATFMGYHLLKQYHSEKYSLLFTIVFIFATITPIYIWWLTADLFNFFILFTGLFFFFYKFKRPWLFYLSAFFFSASVFSKPWNAAAIGIIFLILLYKREWKKFILLSLLSIIIFSGFVVFLSSQTGEFSYTLFQGGERRQFTACILFDSPDCTWERGDNVSFDNFWKKFYLSPKIVALNLFYFIFGRHTGMLIYFSTALFVLILFLFQRKIADDWFVLSSIILSILLFTLLAPDNYFGGSGSLGNRYFFNIFPLFFFLGFGSGYKRLKFSLIPVAIAFIFLSGIYLDSLYHSTQTRYLGLSFPARLFPPEKTQYLSLPTNENPRAFGKLIRDGSNRFQLYFLNDNYHEIENHSFFWSKGTKKLELFLSSPNKVKEFQVVLDSKERGNRVTFKIEDKKREVILNPESNCVLQFRNVVGLKMKNKYIYYITIKSRKSHDGRLFPDQLDNRDLGVKIQIGLMH
jgi:hypothetical protein